MDFIQKYEIKNKQIHKIKEKILIFGTSGHARVVADIINNEKKYNIIGFIDEKNNTYKSINNIPILGNDKVIPYLIDKYNVTKGVIGIGDNFMRYKIFKKIKTISKNFNFVSCTHPSAIVASDVILGSGNVIMPGVISIRAQ